MEPACPLCGAASAPFWREPKRGWSYRRCPACELVFREPEERLELAEQEKRYALHQNRVDDPAYRKFLSPALEAVCARVAAGAAGLDYGCGPGPALAAMLEESGYRMTLYDPIYAQDGSVLKRRYAFVTCTEVAEHFHEPGAEFERLGALLEPGGLLVVMTRLRDGADFPSWGYRHDDTHCCFYAGATMRWIGARRGWALERLEPGLTVFRRPAP